MKIIKTLTIASLALATAGMTLGAASADAQGYGSAIAAIVAMGMDTAGAMIAVTAVMDTVMVDAATAARRWAPVWPPVWWQARSPGAPRAVTERWFDVLLSQEPRRHGGASFVLAAACRLEVYEGRG